MSYTVLGSSLDLLEKPRNRWLCQSLIDGNRHMYLQMTWPSLFTILQRFVHPTRLTYPGYPIDSEKFVELMEETAKQGSEAKVRRERSGSKRSVIDHMRHGMRDDATDDDETSTEAFALLRAGTETQILHHHGTYTDRLQEETQSPLLSLPACSTLDETKIAGKWLAKRSGRHSIVCSSSLPARSWNGVLTREPV